jgi:hypothetical protein
MRVYIRQFDYINNNHKGVGSFTIDQDAFVGFFTSKKGGTILKEILPADSPLQSQPPHKLLGFIRTLYTICSNPADSGYVRDYYMFLTDAINDRKSATTTYLEKYFSRQVSITKKSN